jgi:hypothetical protein
MALLPYTNRVTTQRSGGRDRGGARADGPPPKPTAPPPSADAEAEDAPAAGVDGSPTEAAADAVETVETVEEQA